MVVQTFGEKPGRRARALMEARSAHMTFDLVAEAAALEEARALGELTGPHLLRLASLQAAQGRTAAAVESLGPPREKLGPEFPGIGPEGALPRRHR
jgi:hypothetical protein